LCESSSFWVLVGLTCCWLALPAGERSIVSVRVLSIFSVSMHGRNDINSICGSTLTRCETEPYNTIYLGAVRFSHNAPGTIPAPQDYYKLLNHSS
jgi:hypothetical protein